MTYAEATQIQLDELLRRTATPKIPTVYINTEEAARQLGISAVTLGVYVNCGLVTAHSQRHNKYLLSEILWLKDRPHRGLRKRQAQTLVEEKKRAFA